MKALQIIGWVKYLYSRGEGIQKYIFTIGIAIIISTSCSTIRYLRSEYKTKSLPDGINKTMLVYTTFWGVSGIGIEINSDGFPIVTELSQDFPAHKGGIWKEDVLLEINGQITQGKSIQEIVGMVKGEPGSYIYMKIKRHLIGRYRQFDIKVEKDTILDISYKRGISNGIECITSPHTIIKCIVCEYEQVERTEVKYYEKTNRFEGWIGGYGFPSQFSRIGEKDTTYHNLGSLVYESFKVSTKDNKISKMYKSDGGAILEISLKDFCFSTDDDLVLSVLRLENSTPVSNDIVVQSAYNEIIKKNESAVDDIIKQASSLANQGKYSKAISLYQQTIKEYPTTEIVLSKTVNNLIDKCRDKISQVNNLEIKKAPTSGAGNHFMMIWYKGYSSGLKFLIHLNHIDDEGEWEARKISGGLLVSDIEIALLKYDKYGFYTPYRKIRQAKRWYNITKKWYQKHESLYRNKWYEEPKPGYFFYLTLPCKEEYWIECPHANYRAKLIFKSDAGAVFEEYIDLYNFKD
jgi:hypothetical protein